MTVWPLSTERCHTSEVWSRTKPQSGSGIKEIRIKMAEDKAVVADGKMVNMATTITIVVMAITITATTSSRHSLSSSNWPYNRTLGRTC